MNELYLFNLLLANGMTPEGASALEGNLKAESGPGYNVLETLCRKRLKEAGKGDWTDEAYTAAVDNGEISREEFLHPLPGKQYGYGLAQWTTPARKAGLYDLAKANGKSIADPATQIAYLVQELKTSYRDVWDVLCTTNNVREASDIVLTKFERPADLGEKVKAKRASYGFMYHVQFIDPTTRDDTKRLAYKVIEIALDEVGYLEKKSDKNLYDKTANAGSNNYTKYGKEMHAIYPAAMDFPAAWCDCFVDWCFYTAYGVANAKSLLGGSFDDYTVGSAQLYKNKGAWYTSEPEAGDQVFFHNSVRICHTGLVVMVTSIGFYAVEGNTSDGSEVISNGGSVCLKFYYFDDPAIAGFGRPKYDVSDGHSPITEGWKQASDGQRWWYQYADGNYPSSGWAWLRETTGGTEGWYLFDREGYMLTGIQTGPDGKKYCLCEDPGIDEGKCMVTDNQGALRIADYDWTAKRYVI